MTGVATRLGGYALAFGMVVGVLLLAVGHFPLGRPDVPAQRTHKVPKDLRGTATLTINWDPKAIIQSVTFQAAGHEETYGHSSMSASLGTFSRSYPYVVGAFYAVTGRQNDHGSGFTECEITVAGQVVDAERLESGTGVVYCWVE